MVQHIDSVSFFYDFCSWLKEYVHTASKKKVANDVVAVGRPWLVDDGDDDNGDNVMCCTHVTDTLAP